MMRTREEINEELDQNKAVLEILLDIRKLLIIGINSANEHYTPLCEECGEPKGLRKVYPDRKGGPEEYVCLRCKAEEGS